MSTVCDVLRKLGRLRDVGYHYGLPHEKDEEVCWIRKIEAGCVDLVRCTFKNSALEYREGGSANINGWRKGVDGEWNCIVKTWPWRED
ncbi:uncharacterized protein STEHIDRAFT_164068 [Stereum hirsutum FP-91666 SS1]|nr:uncharacterized protein STEHIDRAFT_164068 [Stereum hirsutum FP-91666 SS1]EIM79042.1 hypothetical protein STEHIDRAFT_164068 [Stereum hirsutum FP-91666 SS1]